MINPILADLRYGKIKDKGFVKVETIDRHKITGEPITIAITIDAGEHPVLSQGVKQIVLTRGSAQQLADDINFLLG